MGELRKQTLSGIKWTGIESLALQVIQFGISIIIARILTPSEYGLIGMIGIFLAVATTFVDSGMTNALVRKKKVTNYDYSTVFIFNIGISIVCYSILFVCSPFIAEFFNEPELENIVRVISLNLVIGAIGGVQGAKFTRELNFKVLAKISTSSALISGIIGVFLAYTGFGVWALVFQQVFNVTIAAVLKFLLSKWKPAFEFSSKSFKELFGFGSKLLASGLLNTIYIHLTTLLIGKFYTPRDLGYYSRGQSFPQLLDTTILNVLGKVTFPILSRYQDRKEDLVHIYRKYIKVTSMIIYFVLLLLAALSKPVILILLTEKWIEAVPYLQIFCFAFLLDNISTLNLNLLQVIGRSDLFLRLEVIKKTISVVMLLGAVPFGVMAICVVRMIYSFIATIINTYYTGKIFKLGFVEQFRDFSPYILYSVISVIPVYLLTFSDLSNIIEVILGTILASIIYLFVLWCKKDSIYREYIVGLVFPKVKDILHLNK